MNKEEINNYIEQGFLSIKDYIEMKKSGYSDEEIIKSIDDSLRAKRKIKKIPSNY